jgi:hypothetical protein
MIRKVPLFTWPTLMVVAVYCSWVAAYAQLGRRPKPSMDDPKGIGGTATDVYTFCVWVIGILFAIWTVAVILRLMKAAPPEEARRNGRLLEFCIGATAIGVPFSLLVLHDAILWFID